MTAGMISAIPSMTCQLKASLKMRHPMMTAVSGSKAPRTAVMVLPMRLTLYTKLTLVMNVQMIAREARLLHCRSVVIGELSLIHI